MKKIFIITAIVLAIAGIAALKRSGSAEESLSLVAGALIDGTKAIVYKSPTCGCCNNYVSYLKKQGFEVEARNVSDQELQDVKSKHNIPNNLGSCHTTVIGDYAIEGHIPVQSIAKLLDEKPDVSGIALPGMPEGSPGMGGVKRGTFAVSSFTQSGDVQSFDRP